MLACLIPIVWCRNKQSEIVLRVELVGNVCEELPIWSSFPHNVLAFEGHVEGEIWLCTFWLVRSQERWGDLLHLFMCLGEQMIILFTEGHQLHLWSVFLELQSFQIDLRYLLCLTDIAGLLNNLLRELELNDTHDQVAKVSHFIAEAIVELRIGIFAFLVVFEVHVDIL